MYISSDRIKKVYNLDNDYGVMLSTNDCIDNSKYYILDAYPMSQETLEMSVKTDVTIFLNASVITCTNRLLNVNVPYETIRERYVEYVSKILPLKSFYERYNKIINIDANKSAIDVYSKTIIKLKKFGIKDVITYINRIL